MFCSVHFDLPFDKLQNIFFFATQIAILMIHLRFRKVKRLNLKKLVRPSMYFQMLRSEHAMTTAMIWMIMILPLVSLQNLWLFLLEWSLWRVLTTF